MSAGFANLPLPREHGGRGLSLVDCVLAFEAMADAGGDPGFLFSLGVNQFVAGLTVLHAGNDDHKEQWLKDIAHGRAIGALAVSEEEAGSDSFAMAATARPRDDGGFTLDGRKVWITNAPVADLFFVLARSDDIPGAFGISAFAVPTQSPGVTVEVGPQKAGLRGAPWGSVSFSGVELAENAMIGGRGGGAAVFQEAMRWERCGLFAIAVGLMSRVLAAAIGHARDRRQFGAALIENDVVARTLAEMRTRLETARLLLYKASASIDKGEPDDLLIALAKAHVSEAAIANGVAAQGLFGALGVLEESQAMQALCDVLPFRVLSGPNEIQYRIAARHLLQS